MTSIRHNKNPYQKDISRTLQDVLNANGMQAHIGIDAKGDYMLITQSHNAANPRSYKLTDQQVYDLKNSGSYAANKKAYETFTRLVKDDYYIPGSYVAARNANSPVNMGLDGYTIQDGEYGYRSPRFTSFDSPRFGRFSNPISNILEMIGVPRLRRVGGRPFVDYRNPVVMERPDGYLKPGELQSGSYGFYDKGNQQRDVLSNMDVKAEPLKIEYPKGQATPLNSITSKVYASKEKWQEILSSHGIDINEKNNTLTIKTTSFGRPLEYSLTEEEKKKILSDKFKAEDFSKKETKPAKGKKSVKDEGVSIDERLKVINKAISADFADKITKDHLNTKDYIDIKLKPEVEKELKAKYEQPLHNQPNDIIQFEQARASYRTGFLNQLNTIGVVDGRALAEEGKNFYVQTKHGRALSVGEIRAYAANDGQNTTYKMSAVINNQVFTHDIKKEDYVKFLNYNDEYRFKLFDKLFDEVKIKNSSYGQMVDPFDSKTFEENVGVVNLEGDYKISSATGEAKIVSAMAFKDVVSGTHILNVVTDKDAVVWTTRLTDTEFTKLQTASNDERAKLIAMMIPAFAKSGIQIEKMPDLTQKQEESTEPKKEKTTSYDDYKHDSSKMNVVEQEALHQKNNGQNKEQESSKENKQTLESLQAGVRTALLGDAITNGAGLENMKPNKEWIRGDNEHGRAVEIGDIVVRKKLDADNNIIQGKYEMSAVIDGVTVSHDITQKQFDKFKVVNDYQRMKMFDKIFDDVKIATKEGQGFNLGAAILAAVTVGAEVVTGGLMARSHPRPNIYMEENVFYKEGVVSKAAVSSALYEANVNNGKGSEREESRGIGLT